MTPLRLESLKAGFSVLEAIIVLAITGLALTLIFSIGSKASEQGFRLGRRALDSSDRTIAIESYRALLSGVVLPQPTPTGADLDPAFSGTATSLSALSSVSRPTLCTSAGRVLVTLSLKLEGTHTILGCKSGAENMQPIFQLNGRAAFSYSLDGVKWRDSLDVRPIVIGSGVQNSDVLTSASLGAPPIYIRLATEDGSEQILSASPPQRPLSRPNPQAKQLI